MAMLLSEAPSGVGLTRNVALPGFPAGFESPGHGIVDACRREVDFDLRVGAGQGRLELDRQRPGQPRAEIEAALGASRPRRGRKLRSPTLPRRARGRHPHGSRRRGPRRRPRSSAHCDRPRTRPSPTSSFSSARNLSIWRLSSAPLAWNCVSSGRAVFPSLRSRTRSPSACPLTVAGSSVRPAWRRNGSRIKQIGERVGRSGHMRLRGSVDDGSRRDIGNGEGEVVRLHPPRRRQRPWSRGCPRRRIHDR